MPIFESVHDGIHCVDADYVRDKLASIYLLQQNDEVAIIETGTQHSLENVLMALSQLGIDNSQIKYVIPTHVHLDHAGGAGAMMQQFKQARLIIHPRGARHMIDPSRIIQGTKDVYGESLFGKLYGEIIPIDKQRVDIAEDQDHYSLGSRELLFIDSPGHARHHFCIYDEQSQGIFTGDSFGIAYPPFKHHPHGLIPSSTPVQFDPEAMFACIDRLLSYQPRQMYLTHYGMIDRPAERSAGLKQWISEYMDLCERIQPQDTDREQQLENEMGNMIFTRLLEDASLRRDNLAYLLDTDIKLNSQGLAIWWRSTQHG